MLRRDERPLIGQTIRSDDNLHTQVAELTGFKELHDGLGTIWRVRVSDGSTRHVTRDMRFAGVVWRQVFYTGECELLA